MAKQEYSFEPRGLDGWLIVKKTDARGSWWVFRLPENVPNAFAWDEATGKHSVPVFDRRDGPFNGAECREAKQAVAAAWRFKEQIEVHLASI